MWMIVGGVAAAVAAPFLPLTGWDRFDTFVRALGPIIAGSGVLLVAMSVPTLVGLRSLRKAEPGLLLLVCKGTRGLNDGIARSRHASDFDRPRIRGDFFLGADSSGLRMWSGVRLMGSIAAEDILSMGIGTVQLVRRELCLRMEVAAREGRPSVLEIPIGRDGWETWAISKRPELEARIEQLRAALQNHRPQVNQEEA
ncbi:hypothetical protein [Homoserinibacter sp. GY 40078]|uniref:hypothetical protein n=1 Tax=Homoserinibacter sp. GY 40078 TaxID=2603275 RepID=UPI0011C86E85|nr:hypothetical protein [Homoserinibacter sp. GY 40078]TXK18763.1 hypothetical protein FVQ89_02135 [Homoserinibacter sp. GY 40078]